MKARRTIVNIIGFGSLITIAVLIYSHWFLAEPKVDGHFTPEDVRQIRGEASRHRWEVMRSSLLSGHFRLFSALCMSSPDRGLISETTDLPDWPQEEEVLVAHGKPLRAYVLSGRLEYGLEQTTNGWRMRSLGYH